MGAPFATIAAFEPTLEVIASKQRPRKLRIVGSDGLPYTFLLKGVRSISLSLPSPHSIRLQRSSNSSTSAW